MTTSRSTWTPFEIVMRKNYSSWHKTLCSKSTGAPTKRSKFLNKDSKSPNQRFVCSREEAKSALAQALQSLQATESKLKAMEEDFNSKHEELEKLKKDKELSEAACQTNSDNSSSKPLSLLEQQVSE